MIVKPSRPCVYTLTIVRGVRPRSTLYSLPGLNCLNGTEQLLFVLLRGCIAGVLKMSVMRTGEMSGSLGHGIMARNIVTVKNLIKFKIKLKIFRICGPTVCAVRHRLLVTALLVGDCSHFKTFFG